MSGHGTYKQIVTVKNGFGSGSTVVLQMYLRMHHLYSNEAVMTTYDDNKFVP